MISPVGVGAAGFIPAVTPGNAPAVDHAKAHLEAAWRVFLMKRTDADFQERRDQRDWTAEKYRRFDRGDRMPPDWGVKRDQS